MLSKGRVVRKTDVTTSEIRRQLQQFSILPSSFIMLIYILNTMATVMFRLHVLNALGSFVCKTKFD